MVGWLQEDVLHAVRAAWRAAVGPTALPPPDTPGTTVFVLFVGGVRGGGRGPALRWAPRAPARLR
jgi:hypothetical protein